MIEKLWKMAHSYIPVLQNGIPLSTAELLNE